jgi:hypothetical protein
LERLAREDERSLTKEVVFALKEFVARRKGHGRQEGGER